MSAGVVAMGAARVALLSPPRPNWRRARAGLAAGECWDAWDGLPAGDAAGAVAEPVWLSDPACAPARVLAALEVQDAENAVRRPVAEPEPGPWDDPGPDAGEVEGDAWGEGGGGRGRDRPARGGGWRSVGAAGDLAPGGHVPLAVGGHCPAALVELVGADPAVLHPGELVDALAAAEQLKAWADAAQLSALAELTDWCATLRGVGDGFNQVPAAVMAGAEAGPALGVSPRSAAMRVGLAQDLRRLPATMAALRAGRLSLAKVRAVSEALVALGDADAALVEAQVLQSHGHATQAGLVAALRRAVIAADPAAAEDRHRRAVKTRGVWRQNLEDGLARLEWLAPADQIATAHAAITTLARAAQDADRSAARAARAGGQPEPEVRTLDQARCDVLADLTSDQLSDLLTTHPTRPSREPGQSPPRHAEARGAGRGTTGPGDLGPRAAAAADAPSGSRGAGLGGGRLRPRIDVVVGLGTLLGLNDLPAELAGYGPIPASIARRLAAEGTWRRLLTDPTGRVLDYSTRAHDPPPDLAAFVQARDRTCRFPGCRMPAIRCDLDHNLPHPDGDTDAGNLCCLCRTHHRIKTLTDTALTNDGHAKVTWTMPSGKTWTTHPPPTPPDPPTESVSPAAAPHPAAELVTGDPMTDDPPRF